MASKLGLEGKTYFKAGGQSAGGNWTELSNIKDLTLSLEKSQSDMTTRANNGWRAQRAALKEVSVEFKMVWDTADTGFTAIRNAFLNNTIIGLQILDGAAGQGLQADFDVVSFGREEPLEEGMTVPVTVKIAYSATAPSWIGV